MTRRHAAVLLGRIRANARIVRQSLRSRNRLALCPAYPILALAAPCLGRARDVRGSWRRGVPRIWLAVGEGGEEAAVGVGGVEGGRIDLFAS
jgi:hypothetical protein